MKSWGLAYSKIQLISSKESGRLGIMENGRGPVDGCCLMTYNRDPSMDPNSSPQHMRTPYHRSLNMTHKEVKCDNENTKKSEQPVTKPKVTKY